ncbi:type II toxin-antitoxin system Phd/YefM family antitoxin [Clostridium sp. AUH-JLR23]|uniref:type II toxin-antitoxin system Phd/YefM family antitoxin n=1 Tax=Clostridium sp. AUH-JLR23 TaxID=1505062 RepID=UPI0035687AF4
MEHITIRPISDLRTKLTEISKEIHESNQPIYLTKNGYGDMVLMSMEAYQEMIENNEIYLKMKEAKIYAELNTKRLSHEEVFNNLHEFIDSL